MSAPKIFHATPWQTGNIGGGLNAFMSLLPDDAWACLRDGDTMFLTSDWGKLIERIVATHGDEYAAIGAMTNRLRDRHQLHGGLLSDDGNLSRHMQIALDRQEDHGASVKPTTGDLAGMCLIVSVAWWKRINFPEHSIVYDRQWCARVRSAGGQLGVAQGLYLFHAYRWGKARPADHVEHLRCA